MTVKLANNGLVLAQPVYIVDGANAQPVAYTGGTSSGGNTTITAVPVTSNTVTKTTVTANTTVKQFLAANASRKGATIRNTDTNTLYIDTANTVLSTDHMQAIVSGAYYEVPFNYTGPLYGIWSTANTGAALIREFT